MIMRGMFQSANHLGRPHLLYHIAKQINSQMGHSQILHNFLEAGLLITQLRQILQTIWINQVHTFTCQVISKHLILVKANPASTTNNYLLFVSCIAHTWFHKLHLKPTENIFTAMTVWLYGIVLCISDVCMCFHISHQNLIEISMKIHLHESKSFKFYTLHF